MCLKLPEEKLKEKVGGGLFGGYTALFECEKPVNV